MDNKTLYKYLINLNKRDLNKYIKNNKEIITKFKGIIKEHLKAFNNGDFTSKDQFINDNKTLLMLYERQETALKIKSIYY